MADRCNIRIVNVFDFMVCRWRNFTWFNLWKNWEMGGGGLEKSATTVLWSSEYRQVDRSKCPPDNCSLRIVAVQGPLVEEKTINSSLAPTPRHLSDFNHSGSETATIFREAGRKVSNLYVSRFLNPGQSLRLLQVECPIFNSHSLTGSVNYSEVSGHWIEHDMRELTLEQYVNKALSQFAIG